MDLIRSVTVAICVASVSGCSPYVYKQEIANFSSGVNATVSSYKTGQESVSTMILQAQQVDYANAKAKLTLGNGCLDTNSPPPNLEECALVPFGSQSLLSNQTQAELRSQKQVARAGQSFEALKLYADALSALINADDNTSLNQASQNLTAAVGAFSAAVVKVAPGAALPNTGITPTANLFSLSVTAYLDKQRYAVLRATVPAMDVHVAAVSKTMTDALLSIRQVLLAHMVDDLTIAIEPFQTGVAGKLKQSEFTDQLAALQTKVTAFNQARASDPSATIDAMAKAHNQLAAALLNGTDQGLAVLAMAQNFATAAGQLKTSIIAGSSGTATNISTLPKVP